MDQIITNTNQANQEVQKSFPYFLVAGLSLVIVISFFVFYLLGRNKGTPLLSAVIAYAEGQVEYQQNNQGWKTAVSGQTITQGTSLRVLSQGKAIVNFDDGSSIRLDKDTTVQLADLSPDHMVITNSTGQVYSRVIRSDRQFIVDADGVSYQAMGTAFKTINEPDEKGVQVYHSQVKVLGVSDSDQLLVQEGSQYYLVNTANVDLANAVTAIDLANIDKDEFVVWNSQEDSKNSDYKDDLGVLNNLVAMVETTPTNTPTKVEPTSTPKPTAKPTEKVTTDTSGQITVTGTKLDNGIKFTWTVSDTDSNLGFKIVRSENANPVYPGNDYKYLSEPSARSYTWDLKDGKTYHFRVCKYTGSGCSLYSNDITVTAPSSESESSSSESGSVTSISLSGSGNHVSWILSGYSGKGFKVVWSKNSGPTYPLRNDADKYHYYAEPDRREDTIDAFSGTGTYFVRVCEYLGGSCGVYSNEIQVSL